MGPGDLHVIMEQLQQPAIPELLVGTETSDDAGVYRLNEREALVVTADFITPPTDDARLYGQIAAANSLSDVYAMGGRPLTALALCMFPKALEQRRGTRDPRRRAGQGRRGGRASSSAATRCAATSSSTGCR